MFHSDLSNERAFGPESDEPNLDPVALFAKSGEADEEENVFEDDVEDDADEDEDFDDDDDDDEDEDEDDEDLDDDELDLDDDDEEEEPADEE
ncbi:MAG: hypothetical protein HYR85_00035 [Planctomycetes bacterium]|nr:hypothetical protein [Planctomycetota bacterium]MBI3845938.1 hypothetical protein [Planctomycetota bacterium]